MMGIITSIRTSCLYHAGEEETFSIAAFLPCAESTSASAAAKRSTMISRLSRLSSTTRIVLTLTPYCSAIFGRDGGKSPGYNTSPPICWRL